MTDGKEAHLKWLREQLVAKERDLNSTERDLQEIEAKAKTLREEVAYFKGILSLIVKGEKKIIESGMESMNSVAGSRNVMPKDMMRTPFVGMTAREAAQMVINQLQSSAHVDEIAKLIYDMRSEEEVQAVRRSFSSELRRGSAAGLWKKVGRNQYAPNYLDIDEQLDLGDQDGE